MTDYALTEGPDGKVMAHKANCPIAKGMAAAGEPVITLFQCENGLPKDIPRHSCLQEE
jgi:hypothetical protein